MWAHFINHCRCTPKVEWREQNKWNRGQGLYGFGVGVKVRVHTGQCPLCDEVLATRVVKL